MKPYFGVLAFCFKALNKVASAPRIWIVDAGAFANLSKEPALLNKRAPTKGPTIYEKFGAILAILYEMYKLILSLASKSCKISVAKAAILSASS